MTTVSAKLGQLLRRVAATALGAAAKFIARGRLPESAGEMPPDTGPTEIPRPAISAADGKSAPDELSACANSPAGSGAPPPMLSSGPAEREKLIRRRWNETGIKMWSSDLHGSGKATLKIQGQAELLPVAPGESSRAYDKLEFKLIEGRIVCEDVVIDPPKGRRSVEHRTSS
jgi:hypothetical protein